jgi:hypothetical protein
MPQCEPAGRASFIPPFDFNQKSKIFVDAKGFVLLQHVARFGAASVPRGRSFLSRSGIVTSRYGNRAINGH